MAKRNRHKKPSAPSESNGGGSNGASVDLPVADARPPVYLVKSADPAYSGIHPEGLRFFGGEAKTPHEAVADKYEELGFDVSVEE